MKGSKIFWTGIVIAFLIKGIYHAFTCSIGIPTEGNVCLFCTLLFLAFVICITLVVALSVVYVTEGGENGFRGIAYWIIRAVLEFNNFLDKLLK